MAETKTPLELEKHDWIVLWVGPGVGEVEAEVTKVETADHDPDMHFVWTEEMDWPLAMRSGDEVVLSE
ncbi:hypothetical protein ACFVH6_25635 [Spirillospora sp. NPDC127200]